MTDEENLIGDRKSKLDNISELGKYIEYSN